MHLAWYFDAAVDHYNCRKSFVENFLYHQQYIVGRRVGYQPGKYQYKWFGGFVFVSGACPCQ